MGKKKNNHKTKKPTGITITRKGYKFTAAWKRGEKYTSEQFHYKVNSGSWRNKNISKTTTKEDFTLSENDWNPKKSKTISKVSVKITGKAKGDKKTDVTKVMKIKKPNAPKIQIGEIGDNYVIFTITKPDEIDKKPITRIDYKYVVISKYTGTDKSKKYWEDIEDSHFDSNSKTVTATLDGDISGKDSKTIIIRAKCRGIGGDSKYVYKHHVFASPSKPEIKNIDEKNDVVVDKDAGTTRIKVGWVAKTSTTHPIDFTTIQYLVGTPIIEHVYEDFEARDEVDLEPSEPGSGFQFYAIIPHNVSINKVVVTDEEDQEIPRSAITFWTREWHDSEGDNKAKLCVKINDEYSQVAEDGIVRWVATDTDVYYYDESLGKYQIASYSQKCNFENNLDFYKLALKFRPSSGNPSNGLVQRDTSDADYAVLMLDMLVGYDQCIWVRVAVKHDGRTIYSDYALAQKGQLTPPTITNISNPDPVTFKETISVTNNSTVPNSFIALIYQDADSSEYSGKVLGIIPSGMNQANIQCPDFTGHTPITFGAYAVCGSINDNDTVKKTETGIQDPIIVYSLYDDMTSDKVFNAGHVPLPPEDVEAVKLSDKKGTIQVTWKNQWLDATGAEISWANHDDAWYSTSGPSSYTVESIKEPKLNISDLETGQKWYIRVRMYRTLGDNSTIYGPPSNIVVADLSEQPSVPVLTITPGSIAVDKEIKASWTYVVEDDSEQSSAILAEVIEGQDDPVVLKQLTNESYCRFTPQSIIDDETIDLDWSPGTTHDLVIQVSSTGGKESPWSDPVSVSVLEPIICSIQNTNLVRTIDNVEQDAPTFRNFPLTVEIGGGDDNDIEAILIRRYDDYPIVRPDDSDYVGYNGEIICYKEADDYTNIISIEKSDLEEYGTQFDDGALYQIVASIQTKDPDGNDEQMAIIPDDNNAKIIPDPNGGDGMFEYFTVNWETQAVIPNEDEEHPWITAEIQYDEEPTNLMWKTGIGIIHIGTSPVPNDTAHLDIYRLSAGKPQLIYKDATFNTDYVDPYPTIGERGGYRVVYITENGDYITNDGPAWVDLDAYLNTKFQLIDFDDKEIIFKFNVSFDNSWNKSFTMTHYLGGGIEGDWIEGVEHTHNIKGVTIDDLDIEAGTLDNIRDLAEYAGICHVRTIEGFNYTANINVSDSSNYNSLDHSHDISFNITEVANLELDGMTLEEWNKEESEEAE